MSRELTLELQSIRDGKASIEHQIDIHVNDLFGVQDNLQLSLEDVLEGLKYVMNYRLKGGRLPNLDHELMKRLCEGLLLNMQNYEGGLLKRKLTHEANEAFILFGEFLEEVEEFRQIVGEKNISDLYNSLKLHKRCRKDADPDVKQAAVAIIYMLTTWFSQFSDWHELVKEEDQSDVEKVIKELTDSIKKPSMPPLQGAALPPPSLYFDRDVTRLLKMFRTSLNDGLSSTSIPSLLEHYGRNQLPEPPKPSILMMIFNQLKDFIVVMLLVFSIVTGAKQDFKGMGVLLFVVVLNTLIGFIQEFKANKALEALQKLTVPKARVVRDGEQSIIDSNQLVPGDIVILEEGDSVPADLRIVENSNLELIESILTGESVPTSKNIKKIMTKTRNLPLGDCKGNAFMSTIVAKGRGKGLVVRTGDETEIGKISAAITSVPKMRTPIQKKLFKLGIWLVVVAVLLCVLVVVIGIAYKRDVNTMISIGISLAVSVIPEGLVAVTTVTMAIGVRRMAARSAIVRTLPAVETLGSVTVICSDKTGTLTEGKMGPCELWTADNSIYSFTEPTSLDPNKGGIIFHSLEYRNQQQQKQQQSTPKNSSLQNQSSIDNNNNNNSSNNNNYDHENEKKNFIDSISFEPQELSRNPQDSSAHLFSALMISSLCNNSSIIEEEEEEINNKNKNRNNDNNDNDNNNSNNNDARKQWKGIGDPTEVALVLAAQKGGFSKSYWENNHNFLKVHEKPFDSERKLMSVVYKINKDSSSSSPSPSPSPPLTSPPTTITIQKDENENKFLVLAKGAPEELLQKCTHYLAEIKSPNNNNTEISHVISENHSLPLTEEFIDIISDQSSRMASKGLRILGLALKSTKTFATNNNKDENDEIITENEKVNMEDNKNDNSNSNDNSDDNIELQSETSESNHRLEEQDEENNLIFIGLIGLIDPPKKAVKESIRICKLAGIKVIMITGDHIATATAIATDIGILDSNSSQNMNSAIRGAELDLLSDEAISELNPFPTVFARVSPDNKLKIVKALQNLKNIAAMTGDGVNDAPAIKAADVGVAMGLSGTEITKQAADIILSNDDFSTIVAAVEEGRRVFDNILKFIVYLLSCNSAEIILMLICAIINIDLPFTTIMILWANIIADIPPAISLGVEPAERDIMKRKPRNPNAGVLDIYATTILITQSFVMALLSFGVYIISLWSPIIHIELADARSLTFAALTSMQLLQGFFSRTLYESVFKTGFFTNKWMIVSVIGSFVALLLGIYVPGLREWLDLTPVPALGWVKIAICVVIQLIISELGKFFGRRYRDKKNKTLQ